MKHREKKNMSCKLWDSFKWPNIYAYMESPKERSGDGMRNQKKI